MLIRNWNIIIFIEEKDLKTELKIEETVYLTKNFGILKEVVNLSQNKKRVKNRVRRRVRRRIKKNKTVYRDQMKYLLKSVNLIQA